MEISSTSFIFKPPLTKVLLDSSIAPKWLESGWNYIDMGDRVLGGDTSFDCESLRVVELKHSQPHNEGRRTIL